MSVKLSRNYQMDGVASRKRAPYTPCGLCSSGEREHQQTLYRTWGHQGTGTRQLVRTLGERWPLLLYPRGSRGKSARRTKNPPHGMRGSVRMYCLLMSHVPMGLLLL